jgi:hypothetical protein
MYEFHKTPCVVFRPLTNKYYINKIYVMSDSWIDLYGPKLSRDFNSEEEALEELNSKFPEYVEKLDFAITPMIKD